MVAALTAAHAEGRASAGLDVTTGEPRDLSEDHITDLHSSKWCATPHPPPPPPPPPQFANLQVCALRFARLPQPCWWLNCLVILLIRTKQQDV